MSGKLMIVDPVGNPIRLSDYSGVWVQSLQTNGDNTIQTNGTVDSVNGKYSITIPGSGDYTIYVHCGDMGDIYKYGVSLSSSSQLPSMTVVARGYRPSRSIDSCSTEGDSILILHLSENEIYSKQQDEALFVWPQSLSSTQDLGIKNLVGYYQLVGNYQFTYRIPLSRLAQMGYHKGDYLYFCSFAISHYEVNNPTSELPDKTPTFQQAMRGSTIFPTMCP
jgi:hypothetical protein